MGGFEPFETTEDSPLWHTDRSRFIAGFSCSWKRLLGYHAFGTGLSTERQALPLTVGLDVHKTLELLLNHVVEGSDITDVLVNQLLARKADRLLDYGQHTDDDELKDARDIAFAIPHAYARIVIPWLKDGFRVHAIEEEYSHQPGYITIPVVPSESTDPHMRSRFNISFNSRPDFVAEDLSTEKLTVHDYKTASSFQEAREIMTYADNVQMMINSAQIKWKEDLRYYPDYYVHILLKGNKWSPSPLIHAYHRVGALPMQQEDWQPKFWLPPAAPGGKKRSIGRQYTRKRVSEHHQISEWVQSMPSDVCAEQTIILGPFNVIEEKVVQFMRGLRDEEEHWACRTLPLEWKQWTNPEFQALLDMRFPRTFQCYSYGTRCEFYNLCFKGPGWDLPFDNGYIEREPHHAQEPKGERIG